jgi:uncharacterized protein (DUF1501 family)
MAGGRVAQMAFANPSSAIAATNEILVLIFLRGGMDGLNFLAPFDDPIYTTARGDLAIPATGDKQAILLDPKNGTFTSSLGLHAKGAPLKELYDSGELAFVHACGLDDDTRSHFDAMDYIERGTPGNKLTATGWLTRHLQIVDTNSLLPALSADSSSPTSLLSSSDAIAMHSPQNFDISAPWRYSNNGAIFNVLKKFYTGAGGNPFDIVGQRTIQTIETLKTYNVGAYTPRPGVTYPNGSFSESLQTVAQAIKLDLGLQVATVDFGGWDTHENQGSDGEGYFADRIEHLAQGLHAFYSDLVDLKSRLTIVVMSEFGRRLGANDSHGTDHGHGNVMTVIGGNVNGGKVYGNWPGLADLDQRQDLKITTDFRVVLGEVVTRRLGNTKLGQVFPGLTAAQYQPLELLRGSPPGPIEFQTNPNGSNLSNSHAVFVPIISSKC